MIDDQPALADGHRNVVAGASAIDIKRGLDRAVVRAVEALQSISRPVTSDKERQQVASISAHNDEAIGKLVVEAMAKVGRRPSFPRHRICQVEITGQKPLPFVGGMKRSR